MKLSEVGIGRVLGIERAHERNEHFPIAGRSYFAERPTADTLKRIADALGVSGNYLPEGSTDAPAMAQFEDRELPRRFQEVQDLPDRDKEIVKELLDAFLTRKQLQQPAAG